jgi:lysophospholipase L1-like esterase
MVQRLLKGVVKMRTSKVFCCLILIACWVSFLLPAANAQSFCLRDGDTVVFYGDSITAQNLYNQFVELYTVTRFPAMRVHFYGAGVGGDRVSGGIGGPIDERLARDVYSHKPTVVTVMLGMNDGGYRAATEEIDGVYSKGYEHLLESIKTNAPGARITLLGPSPFDDVSRPAEFAGGYNAVMLHFGDLDRDLARKFGGTYINLNPPVTALLAKAQGLDPLAARLILPDRVHPEVIAHWVMAETLLKGWNAPGLVSSVTVDGQAGKVIEAQNATADHLERDQKSLRWTELEKSLPLAFNRKNQAEDLLLKLSDLEEQLNQESLRLTGLDAGQYKLSIDGMETGTFSAEELQAGINLADYPTPMRQQSQRVSWMVSDREKAHSIRMQMQIKKTDLDTQQGRPDEVEAFERYLEDAIYEEATPKPHAYLLGPAEPKP